MIANAAALTAHGMTELRGVALRIASAGIAACDPGRATSELLELSSVALRAGDHEVRLEDVDRIVVLGAGKASARIARAIEDRVGDRLSGGAVAVRAGEECDLRRVELLVSDHPLPTARSVAAGRRLLELALELGPRDLVLACFTGGSSALAALPAGGITIEDKRTLTRLLLGAGIPIWDTNVVRRQTSALKGGRLAAAIAPARIINLTVSDVVGDPLVAITDPTVPDDSTPADAIAVLREHGLWAGVPRAVQQHLERGVAAPPIDHPPTIMLASGRTACDAMVAEAMSCGFPATTLSTGLEGESRDVGRLLGGLARDSALCNQPFATPCVLVGAGGESTVTLTADDRFGAGGPNQEVALAAALELTVAHPVALVSMDTDGADGGTHFAGGIVDGLSAQRATELGVDLGAALHEHTATAALERLGDGIVTGPTGTNVNDLFAIVVGAR